MLFALLIKIRNQKTGQVVKKVWAKQEPDYTKRATGTKAEMSKFATELWNRCNPIQKQFIEYSVCELTN